MFLNLYGFSRNISMTALLAVPILIAGMISTGFEKHKLYWIIIALAIFVGMFYRYLKFFKHYTEEVFRAYAEAPEPTQQAKS